MEIAEPIRFVAGLALLAVGVAFLWNARGTRGFNQHRQAAMVALAGGGLLVALGLGYIQIIGLFG